MREKPFGLKHALATCIALLVALFDPGQLVAQEDAPKEREQIGEVQGKPVYRDQIRTGKDTSLADELHQLFLRPVVTKYQSQHRKEITPTEEELTAATKHFAKKHREQIKDQEAELREKLQAATEALQRTDLPEAEKKKFTIEKRRLEFQLMPPGKEFAGFLLNNWKFQKHLYDTYGGGRILWQQAGMEAFDANRQWLETLEKQGEFKITDPKLREVIYEYWHRSHGSFLTSDKERIRSEFLEPEWLAKP